MDVRLPNLGEGVDSGSVVSVFVKVGDTISQGQTILELENEKAVAPIPSPAAGRITDIAIKPGDKLSVGQVILSLSEPELAAAGAPQTRPPTPAPSRSQPPAPQAPPAETAEPPHPAPKSPTPAPTGFAPAAAPSIRKLARDLGIDLNRVHGSEDGGRIVLADLRAYIQRLQEAAFRSGPPPAQAQPAETLDFARWGPITSEPLSPTRQVISRRMLESWTTIPHVTQFDTADLTRISELREKHAPAYQARGARLTVTIFVLSAVAGLLKKHPQFNASLDQGGQGLVLKKYVHLGLAVDTDNGLMVPVIRDADSKSLFDLSKEIQQLAERARERKLSLDEMKGGSFTISNQGGIGSAHFTPIINKPEVAILGLGRAALQPKVDRDKVVPRLLLPLSLSYDHRIIDGAHAARFMVDLVKALESFSEDGLRI